MKHLRLALEEENQQEDKTIVMKGPLAEVYTKALDVAYAKPDTVTNEVALESMTTLGFKVSLETQQMDMNTVHKLVEMLSPDEEEGSDEMTVYGVGKDDITPEIVVEIGQELADAKKDNNTNDFILVVDGASTPDGSTEQRYIDLPAALESMVTNFGGRVFHNLADFAKTL